MEGQFPSDIRALTTGGRYLGSWPRAKTPNYHSDSDAVVLGSAQSDVTDAGGWIYGNTPTASDTYGEIYVNCSHTDSKGTSWISY